MLQEIKNGWALIKMSIRVFNRYPKCLVPLLCTWSVYAPIILCIKYGIDWDAFTTLQFFLSIFFIIFFLAMLLSFSCSMLLELIQQLESGQKMSVVKALGYTVSHNLFHIVPIVFVWTVIWFILWLIDIMLSKDKSSEKETLTAENAAKTLAGYRNFSISRAFFQALQKGVRMVVFLILPAIAWENLTFTQAIKKGLLVFRARLPLFTVGFLFTGFAATIIFLPPSLLFIISSQAEIIFPDWVWFMTIIYIALGWSYCIYLEQMLIAQLYLWNLKWEREVINAQLKGLSIPPFNQIPAPSLLDDVHELADRAWMVR